jgi:hypothetical protein
MIKFPASSRGEPSSTPGTPPPPSPYATSTCVLQTTSLAPHAHAHFGGAYLDIQFAEQLAQPRISQVVVHDEGAVDWKLLTVGVDGIVRVRMAAEPLAGFEQDHVVCARAGMQR